MSHRQIQGIQAKNGAINICKAFFVLQNDDVDNGTEQEVPRNVQGRYFGKVGHGTVGRLRKCLRRKHLV